MSSEDDERGKEDNAAPILKPEYAQNHDRAPSGAVGTHQFSGPSFGAGSPYSSDFSRVSYQENEAPEHQKDERPLFVETGDKEVDQAYSSEYRMVGQEEYDRMTGGNEQGKEPSLDDYRRSDNGNQHDREDTGQSESLLDQYRRGRDDDRQGRSR